MFGLHIYQMLAVGVFIESTLWSEVASLFSSLFNARWNRGLLDGFLVLLALQDLVDVYCDLRSALTMEGEKDNFKLCPHSGYSVALALKFLHHFFARDQLTKQETRHELDLAHQYVVICPEEYSKFIRQSA